MIISDLRRKNKQFAITYFLMKSTKTQKSLKFLSTILKIWQITLITACFLFINLENSTAQIPKEWSSSEVIHPDCQLGEGAYWDHKRNCLWFVDIEKGFVQWYFPKKKESGKFPCGMKIGTLVPSSKTDELVLGLQDGIYKTNLQGKDKTLITRPDLLNPKQRLNDGKCDPDGRLWVGSMNLDQSPKKAHLFRLDPTGKTEKILDSISISNGIAWTRDGKSLFYIDTPTRKVMAYDFNQKSGTISNPRVLVTIPDSLGWPDGMTLDRNNNLWIGMWGGYCVSHWSSKDGRYLGKVKVNAPNVTSCAFGGKNFDVLYITTAKQGLKPETLDKFPLSGSVFEAKVGVTGYQMPYWNPVK